MVVLAARPAVMGSPGWATSAPSPLRGRNRDACEAPPEGTSPSRSMSGKRTWWLDLGQTVVCCLGYLDGYSVCLSHTSDLEICIYDVEERRRPKIKWMDCVV